VPSLFLRLNALEEHSSITTGTVLIMLIYCIKTAGRCFIPAAISGAFN